MHKFSLITALALTFCSVSPSLAAASVERRVTVSATPAQVWDAVRNQSANSRRVISSKTGIAVVEEVFRSMPVIGDATCTYEEKQEGVNCLNYDLIKSDKLKEFHGQWKLTPQTGNMLEITLTSVVDSGLHLPFADKITASSTRKMVDQRLSDLRRTLDGSAVRTVALVRN